jgi:MYXO-CTERM domain-containing protein
MGRWIVAPWLLAVLAAPSAARADLCIYDSKQDGTGAALRWTTPPIKYYVNASRLPAADQAAAIAAVQAAFLAWELPCTTLKFQHMGASTSTTDVPGAILVYWGNDAASWTSGLSAYYYSLEYLTTAGDITKGAIGMNAKDYGWSVGAQPAKIDIQTAVTQMIPGVIGFYVGPSPLTGDLGLKLNEVRTTLTQDQKDGARYVYFKADPGCVQPAKPTACATWTPPPDGGPPALDGGVKDKGPSKDGGIAKEGGKDALGPEGGSKDAAIGKEAGAWKDGAARDTIRFDAAVDVAVDRASGSDRTTFDHAVVDRSSGERRPFGDDIHLPPPADTGCNCQVGDASSADLLVLLALLAAITGFRPQEDKARPRNENPPKPVA